MTRHVVLESATGDEVGVIHFTESEPDELILQTLIEGGCLPEDAEPGEFTLDRNYFLADGACVVLDTEGTPVLTLEPESEDDAEDGDEEDPDDDEDDEDEDEDEDEPED